MSPEQRIRKMRLPEHADRAARLYIRCASWRLLAEGDAVSKYAVRFDFPDDASPTYAGLYKGAWGWAPTLATAELFDSPDEAATLAANGYGEYSRRFARVIAVDVGEYPVERLVG